MPFTTLFIDLDDTLYPGDNGLWQAIRQRMIDYMVQRLGFSPAEVQQLRQLYFETYGTTLKGLQIHHAVDASEYMAYVHDLPLEHYLSPNPALRALLEGLPQRKWIFTNADSAHARRVIAMLGLEGCFDGLIDVPRLGYLCKPEIEAYRLALAIAGEAEARCCLLVDDSPRNLAPAHQLGFTTLLVSPNGPAPQADYTLRRLQDLPQGAPDLWRELIAGEQGA
jgi:pyrimidine 5'-nucleotidase